MWSDKPNTLPGFQVTVTDDYTAGQPRHLISVACVCGAARVEVTDLHDPLDKTQMGRLTSRLEAKYQQERKAQGLSV